MKGLLLLPVPAVRVRLTADSIRVLGRGPWEARPLLQFHTKREMKGRVMMDGGEGFQSSHMIPGNVTPSMEAATMRQLQDDCLMGQCSSIDTSE